MVAERFCIWAFLTFLSALILNVSMPMTWWGAALVGGAVGVFWEIAIRYIEEPDDWN